MEDNSKSVKNPTNNSEMISEEEEKKTVDENIRDIFNFKYNYKKLPYYKKKEYYIRIYESFKQGI